MAVATGPLHSCLLGVTVLTDTCVSVLVVVFVVLVLLVGVQDE